MDVQQQDVERVGQPELAPVVIEHWPDHEFVARAKKNCGHVGADGTTCNRGKKHWLHRGYCVSMNELGSGNIFVYQQTKKLWQARLMGLLTAVELPRGLGRVLVEGEMCFPTRVERDQGNFRFFIEKALGDALTEGGWLDKDTWRHYEFGNLALRYAPGTSFTRLTLFAFREMPGWEAYALPAGGRQEALL